MKLTLELMKFLDIAGIKCQDSEQKTQFLLIKLDIYQWGKTYQF